MNAQKIYTQHEENKEWASSLAFYKDETKIMQNRLEEVASKNNSKEVLVQVEHFQNQLILQKELIDQINHAINLDNDAIQNNINNNSIAVDHRSMEDHTATREHIKSFERIFNTLKFDFNAFLSKWM